MASQYVDLPLEGGGSSGITSVNGATGPAITIAAGTGINVGTVGNTVTISNTEAGGTVTSVGLSAPALFTVSGSPVTTTGTLALSYSGTALPVANGGTALTAAATNGQLLIGNGSGYTLATITAGNGISVTNGSGTISIATNSTSAFATKAANYTILSTDSMIFVDTSGAPFTLTLPSPSGLGGKIYRIVDSAGFLATNNLTLAPSASEKIEGVAASKVFQTAWGGWQVTTNGTDWFVF